MNDFEAMIGDYNNSCSLIQKRINELNQQINGKDCKVDSNVRVLLARRKVLYQEVCEMQCAIREMQEYLELDQPLLLQA